MGQQLIARPPNNDIILALLKYNYVLAPEKLSKGLVEKHMSGEGVKMVHSGFAYFQSHHERSISGVCSALCLHNRTDLIY